jgi:hypothetical protein
VAYAFASPREASDTPIPDSIVQELNRKRIALIGFADEEAERVCGAFERVRALPRLFAGDEPPQSDSIRDCSVIMVHVRPASRWNPKNSLPRHLQSAGNATPSLQMELMLGWEG